MLSLTNPDKSMEITVRQKLLLFLISSDPGVRDIYKMIQLFDRADFPGKLTQNLQPLLDKKLIYVAENLFNGTPKKYEITEEGKNFLVDNFNSDELIDHINKMDNPEFLLKLTEVYIAKKNGL